MYVEPRRRLVDWLRRQLIGPAGEGSLTASPLDRYPTGVLHPIDPNVSGIDPASAGQEEAEASLLDDQDDAPLLMTVNIGGDDAVLHLARLAEAPMLD